jgi:hypothetical protein
MKPAILCLGIVFFVQTICLSQNVQRNFADINGDGKKDKVEYKEYGGNIIDIIVSFGTGNGDYNEPFTFSSKIDRGYPDKPWGFIDVNSDNKADFITIRGTPPDKLEQVTYFSKGNGLDIEHRTFTPYTDGGITLEVFPTIKMTGYLDPTKDAVWARGMPSFVYGGNSPESWVRGNAKLDQASGILTITMQLETDALFAGPVGKVTVSLRDCNKKEIAKATTEEVGIGGKDPGSARIVNLSSQIEIETKIAERVCSIHVVAANPGNQSGTGPTTDILIGAFKIAIAYFSGQ